MKAELLELAGWAVGAFGAGLVLFGLALLVVVVPGESLAARWALVLAGAAALLGAGHLFDLSRQEVAR